MTYESNAPIIVGAGVALQRFDDPSQGVEAAVLMQRALENAADDAGSRAILHNADALLIPQGTWPYANPGSIVAPWNPHLRTTVADLGVLQQTLLSRACSMVADGSADVVLVCGGEAKYRALRGQITGVAPADSPTEGVPHERLTRSDDILTPEEIRRGLVVPARQYAMIDTALRYAQGLSAAQHVEVLADLWSGFNAVAIANPHAWSRTVIPRNTFVDAPPSTLMAANPMLAWPYRKLHCSQWNVDQAAGLIVCSAAAAERFAIPRERWVFAHVGIESNMIVPLTRRAALHRAPAVRVAGDAVLAHCGIAPDDFDHLDIYSCFPAAVRVQTAELDIDDHRALTITGGMTFAGGPFNNYTLQAVAEMTHVLRANPTTKGLVTNVSGMLTKYGMSAWSCQPPARPFESLDVSAIAAAATTTVSVDADYHGPARVASYTVTYDKGLPLLGIVIADTPGGQRCLARSSAADLVADMVTNEWCGRSIAVQAEALCG